MRLPHHFLSSPLTVLSTSQTNGQKYTHRDTQTQRSAELQLCSSGGGGNEGVGGTAGAALPSAPSRAVEIRDLTVLHRRKWLAAVRAASAPQGWAPAHGAAQRPGSQGHSGLLWASLPSRGQHHHLYEGTLVLTESWCADERSLRWTIKVCKHFMRGRAWGWLITAAAWPPLCPSLWTWPHAAPLFSFPTSSCKGQGSQSTGKREENYNMEDPFSLFCHFSAVPKISFVQKKKKSLPSAKIFTYHIWKGIVFYAFWNALKMGIKESEAH